MSEIDLDQAKAHQFFSAGCFNACWDFMGKASRTPEDDALAGKVEKTDDREALGKDLEEVTALLM